MEPLNLALLQISPAGTLAGNLEKGLAACRRARALGADIALFPEMWSNGYSIYGRPPEVWTGEAGPAGGDFVRAFQALAAELGMAIGVTFLEAHRGGPATPSLSLTGLAERPSPTPKSTPATSGRSGT